MNYEPRRLLPLQLINKSERSDAHLLPRCLSYGFQSSLLLSDLRNLFLIYMKYSQNLCLLLKSIVEVENPDGSEN